MRRQRALLQSGLFAVLLCLPLLGLLLGVNDEAALAERRRLAEWPGVPRDLASLARYPERFEDWFDDHFGFRSLLIRSNKEIEWRVKRGEVEMVVGREGWLFLGKASRVDRYRCVELPRDHEAAWRSLAARRRTLAEARDVPLLWAMAPNKHTVYADRLPAEVPRRPGCDLGALPAVFAEAGVPFLDLRPALLAARQAHRVFHRTDTHWNELGAFFGARAILVELRRHFPGLPVPSLDDYEVRVQEGVRGGDIADTIRVYGEVYLEDRITLVPRRVPRARPARGSAALDPSRNSRPENRLATTTGRAELPSAVMFHDSFAYALMPVLSESFERIVYVRNDGAFDAAIVDAEAPDVVIVLMAEKKFAFAPVPDPAPLATARVGAR